ncbi:MAG: tetratricopeptide repeat protein, partial [Symploca sp. SIO3E6]|nr:tetratricopeptide repeat protein [Caldora sp. SIO3E6]
MLSRLQAQGVQNRALALHSHDAGISTADRGVAAAFELSWETLPQTAQQLGCLLSLFALAPIPWDLVEQVIKVCNLPPPSGNIFQRLISNLPFFNKTNHQPLSSLSQLATTAILEEARATLRHLHLIQRSDKNTYQLHPLIREFFCYKGEESAEVEEMKQGLATVMVAVAKEIPYPITLELVEKFQPAIPHLQEVARELLEYVTDKDLIWPYTGLGIFYKGQGLYELAEPWFEECKVVVETRLGNKHPDFATSLNNLANLYESQGKYSEAEPLYKDAIAIHKQSLPPNHPLLATNFNNLANLYESQGRYSEAEPLYKDAIAIVQQSLPPNHPLLATNFNNLALLYKSQGRYSEAEPLYKDAIAIDKQSLPPNHPLLATNFNNLALLYESQGRCSEAEPLYKDAIAIIKQSLPPNHPYLASSLNNLAGLYRSQGRYSDAEPLYKDAIAIDKQSLPPNHPSLATDFNNLALLYKSQGRYSEAEPLYLEALDILFRSVGSEHPNTVTVWENFVYFLRQVVREGKESVLSEHPMVQEELAKIKESGMDNG